jgi:protein-L-isoaspartate(D-aspartate) O-methyltransferase
VTTVDVDPEAIARARECLDLAGYDDVRTTCSDGEYGAPGHGPFDRIIIAAQAWDIPPAWTEQLAPGGRLVTPLLTQGVSRSWALDREDGHLVSRGTGPAGFGPMRGTGRNPRQWSAPVDEAGAFLWGDEAADVDRAALAGVLASGGSLAYPVLTVHPAGAPDGDLPSGHVLRKPHTTMVLSWPEAAR